MILDSNYFATNGLWFIIIPMLLCDSNFLIFPPHAPFVFYASRFILFMDVDCCCYSHSSSLESTSNEIATSLSSHHFVLAAAVADFFGFLMKVVELSTYMCTKRRAKQAGKIIAWLSSYTFFGYTGRARVSSFWPSKRFTLRAKLLSGLLYLIRKQIFLHSSLPSSLCYVTTWKISMHICDRDIET